MITKKINVENYFCAFLIKIAATIEKNILGNQTPNPAGNDKLVENVVLNFDKITNTAPITIPAAK